MRGVCDVCNLLDGDLNKKVVKFCKLCKAHLCNKCNKNLLRRAKAALIKLNK